MTHAYDNAGRLTRTWYSTSDPDIFYEYDGIGRETEVRRPGISTINYYYDYLGRRERVSQDGQDLEYDYDLAGRRTRMEWPDGFFVTYDYSTSGELLAINENGTTPLVTYDYTNQSQLKSMTRANGLETAFIYDPVGRSSRLNHKTLVYTDFTYNPASQIVTRMLSNEAYAWDGDYNVDRDYEVNELNQYESAGPASFAYDLNGNLESDGSNTYVYDPENRMTSASGPELPGAGLHYDGLGRLREAEVPIAPIYGMRYLYDGDQLVGGVADVGFANSTTRPTARCAPATSTGSASTIRWSESQTLAPPTISRHLRPEVPPCRRARQHRRAERQQRRCGRDRQP